MRWLVSITNRLNGLEFERTLGDSEGQGSRVLQFMVLQGVDTNLMTEQQQTPSADESHLSIFK